MARVFRFTALVPILIAILLYPSLSEGKAGIDLSVATDESTWKCLQQNYSISYAIIRTYRNTGMVDLNATNTIQLAIDRIGKTVDGYIFPCITSSNSAISKNITCPGPSEQIYEIIDYLTDNNIGIGNHDDNTQKYSIGRLWIDVEDEQPPKYYDGNIDVNIQFMEDMVTTMIEKDIPIGIYTTKTYWTNIMGGILGYSDYPLWYPRYDGVDDMSFFTPFGGWNDVAIKQTGGDVGYCGITQVDSDYMLDN